MLSRCCTVSKSVSKSVGNEVGVKKCEVDNNVMEVTVKPDVHIFSFGTLCLLMSG